MQRREIRRLFIFPTKSREARQGIIPCTLNRDEASEGKKVVFAPSIMLGFKSAEIISALKSRQSKQKK